jgi:drug/metabolite transporter (DMT)-like permease
MKTLSPSIVAVFIYLQPVFATIFAIGLHKDQLSWEKGIAALLIFVGVYLVTQKPQKP